MDWLVAMDIPPFLWSFDTAVKQIAGHQTLTNVRLDPFPTAQLVHCELSTKPSGTIRVFSFDMCFLRVAALTSRTGHYYSIPVLVVAETDGRLDVAVPGVLLDRCTA